MTPTQFKNFEKWQCKVIVEPWDGTTKYHHLTFWDDEDLFPTMATKSLIQKNKQSHQKILWHPQGQKDLSRILLLKKKIAKEKYREVSQ